MNDKPRLIEVAFPLKQASLDSLHEKSAGRQGHISTLHIWPARRPLAASRAALIAALLPDAENDAARVALLERIGGTIVRKTTGEKISETTQGGVLHWGRESSPDLEWFRARIRDAFGGRAPRVLDPFSGGGAIPLEAMRLGCEAVAVDINPVAWLVLRATLRYPQRIAGQKRPLPAGLSPPAPATTPEKSTKRAPKVSGAKEAKLGAAAIQTQMFKSAEAGLSEHVRAWGHWVLERTRTDLAGFYPVVEDKTPLAYLWARTVACKNCRAEIPLLKTRWLCKTKKNDRRVLLTMDVRKNGIRLGIQDPVPIAGTTAGQRREHDARVGKGTMSDAGVSCPSCDVINTMEDIKLEAMAGRLGELLTSVVVQERKGKSYRAPKPVDHDAVASAGKAAPAIFKKIPNGKPDEPLPTKEALGFRAPLYGFDRWGKLFTSRQLLAIGTLLVHTRAAFGAMKEAGYPGEWREAIVVYLACMLDRLANQCSTIARWNKGGQNIEGTFARFALPMVWDFAEVNPIGGASGGYAGAIDWVADVVEHLCQAEAKSPEALILRQSATAADVLSVDVVVTDPPYYDAIPYSDLMDFFYVWLRRSLQGVSPEIDRAFEGPLGPKWSHDTSDGELIDDSSRFGGDRRRSKAAYEDGMARSFQACHAALNEAGRLVIVFAHKEPDAWETLVSAIIRAGFVVDGSWPIQTERAGRVRSLSSAALSASVWLVCKKRPDAARPGWDNRVLDEMRENIHKHLRDFWDAGIRGPDFVWAATGPAMEAYSKHPVVKKANEPGQFMSVSEFLRHVRRIVVDFVVGRVLTHDGGEDAVAGLDDVTTYYLLHRHDFGMEDAPAGACILYAVSCGVSDRDLSDEWDLLARTGGKGSDADDEEDDDDVDGEESTEGSGSKVRLKTWEQRRRKGMGFDAEGRPAPLIDQIHRLLHLWRAGDLAKVDDYLDARALRKNQLFHKLLQALIELAPEGSEERALMESVSNHVSPRSQPAEKRQRTLPIGTEA